MGDYAAFSFRVLDSHRHSIIIDIELYVPVPVQGYPQDKMIPLKAKALIDTGASRSAVSSSFASAAKLSSYGKCTIKTAKDEYISSVYKSTLCFRAECWRPISKPRNFQESIDSILS